MLMPKEIIACMKCPNCGQWNRASLPRCQKCGQPLEDEQNRSPAWKVTLSDDARGKEYILSLIHI